MRGRLRRLEHSAREKMISIPQLDGTVKRFPQSASMEAFVNLINRMGAGEDAPSEHPLVAAARNSLDPEWSQSFFAATDEGFTDPIEDLSE